MAAALDDRPQELSTLKPKKNGYSLGMISSRAFAARRAESIKAKLSSPPVASPEQTRVDLHDTTHLAVMDAEGNAVSLTTSIGPSFGSRVASAELGFLYAHSYRMRSDPAPGARDETEMTPAILSKGGRPFLAIGATGSERIPTAILQVIVNMIDRGMSLERAVSAPRIFSVGDRLLMKGDFSADLVTAMRKRGFAWSWPARISASTWASCRQSISIRVSKCTSAQRIPLTTGLLPDRCRFRDRGADHERSYH